MSVPKNMNHSAYISTPTTVRKHNDPMIPSAWKYATSPGYGH